MRLIDFDPKEITLPVVGHEPDDAYGRTRQWDILIGGTILHPHTRTGVGVTLLCPHCVRSGIKPSEAPRVALYVSNPSDGLGLLCYRAGKQPLDSMNLKNLGPHDGGKWDEQEVSGDVDWLRLYAWHRSGESFKDMSLLPNEKFFDNRGYFREHVTWVVVDGLVIPMTARWTTHQDYLPTPAPDWRRGTRR
jgi:hypothetical protein